MLLPCWTTQKAAGRAYDVMSLAGDDDDCRATAGELTASASSVQKHMAGLRIMMTQMSPTRWCCAS